MCGAARAAMSIHGTCGAGVRSRNEDIDDIGRIIPLESFER